MANFDLKDRSAIVGVGNSIFGRRLMRSAIDLACDAITNAVDDAALSRGDVDGMIVSFGSPIGADCDTLAQVLGLKLRTYSQTWAHGRFTASCIQWAAMMVNAGLADAVACLAAVAHRRASSHRDDGGSSLGMAELLRAVRCNPPSCRPRVCAYTCGPPCRCDRLQCGRLYGRRSAVYDKRGQGVGRYRLPLICCHAGSPDHGRAHGRSSL